MTSFDTYVIVNFVLLTACAVLHQLIFSLKSKQDESPLREIFSRILEVFGRLVVYPFVIFFFGTQFFDSTFVSSNYIATLFIVIPVSIYIAVREVGGLQKSFKVGMAHVKSKLLQKSNSDAVNVTAGELFIFNLYSYHIFSLSRRHFRENQEASEKISNIGIVLNRMQRSDSKSVGKLETRRGSDSDDDHNL